MENGREEKADAVVALVSGALIGIAATYLFIRMRRNRALRAKARLDHYYDGEDLFI